MSEPMTYCASGCTVRGQHKPTCDDRETCKGCIPRVASHGTLCDWCFQRMTADVAAAPDLVAHLRVIGAPHAELAPLRVGIRTPKDAAETSILPAAWLAADEIHANLASWALLILEEHPNGEHMAGPDEVGAWHTRYGTTVGIAHVKATAALTRWLLPQLEWCAGQEWAAEMRREVSSMVATISARWPTASMVEPEQNLPQRCPRCSWLSLTYTPQSEYGQPFKVSCSNPDCARVWSEDEWEWLVTMVTAGERRAG